MQLQRVTKKFKRRTVLNELDLQIPGGSVVGLLGKNGEGKTTLIKCALGLIKLNGGEAKVFGEDAWSLSADAKDNLGYVPQVISLYPWMKIAQLIDYTAAFYRHWNAGLVSDLVKTFELKRDERVGLLSVGTLQKLAILLAVGHEPKLLVLDEPAASLDPSARRDFLRHLVDIAATGERTVLFSTHITSDLERVADRVAILRGGKIVYHGELDELKETVKRLHVTSSKPLAASFNVPGAMRLRVEGNEALVSVRTASAEMVEQIERDHSASVKIEDLNLEDIFLELHHE
jgi:ABC-2 type transport system ATP-binding protein